VATRSFTSIQCSSCVNSTEGDSHEIIEEVLSNKRVFLTQNLSSDDLVDYLAQERMIDDSTRQKLEMHCFTPMEKNRWIIESLITGPPNTLKRFCAILRKVKKSSYIADELERGILRGDPQFLVLFLLMYKDYSFSNHFPPLLPPNLAYGLCGLTVP